MAGKLDVQTVSHFEEKCMVCVWRWDNSRSFIHDDRPEVGFTVDADLFNSQKSPVLENTSTLPIITSSQERLNSHKDGYRRPSYIFRL